MRVPFAVVLVASSVWAQRSVKADLDCGVFNKKDEVEYLVPTEDGRKITRTFECALDLANDEKGPLTASIWLVTPDGQGAAKPVPITKAEGIDVEFAPGKDFQPCTN